MKMYSKSECNLIIIKFLYKLSLEYPFIKTDFVMNGVNNISQYINLYSSKRVSDKLRTELKSIEVMMMDKEKKFIFNESVVTTHYSKSGGQPKELNYFFDEYRKELRSDKLDNLLNDE